MYNGHQKEEGMRDNMRCIHAYVNAYIQTYQPTYVCTMNIPMYIPSLYTYICTHGEVQNANGCWSATCGFLSATCSCLSATQGIYVHTYSHVHMVTNKNMGKMANCQYFSTFPRTVPAYDISLKRHVCMQ